MPGADVDGSVAAAFAVEAVDVFVSGDLAQGQLVQPGHRDLPCMGVPRKHQRHPMRPQRVGLLGDVGQADGGQARIEANNGALDVGVAGVGVVEADDLQWTMANLDGVARVAQHLDTSADESSFDGVGTAPMVVVAEHCEDRDLKAPHQFGEVVEIELLWATKSPLMTTRSACSALAAATASTCTDYGVTRPTCWSVRWTMRRG